MDTYDLEKAARAEAFQQDLRELMKRHHVTDITAEDHYPGYPECGQDIRMTATINAPGGEFRVYVEVDLGKAFYQEP